MQHLLCHQLMIMCKRGNRWKKDSAANKTAFPTQPASQSQQGANSASWKCDKSVSSGNTCTRNNETCRWCAGPGHNNRPMWAKHVPGQCVPQTSSTHSTSGGRGHGGPGGAGRGGVHAAATTSTNPNAKGRADISKTKAIKESKTMFANNELDANELAKKVADLMHE